MLLLFCVEAHTELHNDNKWIPLDPGVKQLNSFAEREGDKAQAKQQHLLQNFPTQAECYSMVNERERVQWET